MIIECICGKKKFEVNSDLIPSTGRTIQCGSCEKVWFFDPNKENLKIKEELEPNISEPAVKQKTKEIKPKKVILLLIEYFNTQYAISAILILLGW